MDRLRHERRRWQHVSSSASTGGWLAIAGYDASIDRVQARLRRSRRSLPRRVPQRQQGLLRRIDPNSGRRGITPSARWRSSAPGAARTRSCCRAKKSVWRSASTLSRRRRAASSRRSSTSGPAPRRGLRRQGPERRRRPGRRRCRPVVAPRGVNGGAMGVISTSLRGVPQRRSAGREATPRESGTSCSGAACRTTRREGVWIQGVAARGGDAARSAWPRAAFRGPTSGPMVCARHDRQHVLEQARARTLVAEIPGRTAPNERIVLAAHVQEPGANDNASGVATLAELAARWRPASADGKIPPPGADADVSLAQRDQRQPALAAGPSRASQAACATCSRWT